MFKLPNTRFKFMSVIGGAIIGVYLCAFFYGIIQVYYLFNHGKIPIDKFELIVSNKETQLYGIVTIIVLYFYSSSHKNKIEETNKKEEE
jgi:uncharacterized membrane protein